MREPEITPSIDHSIEEEAFGQITKDEHGKIVVRLVPFSNLLSPSEEQGS